MLSIVVVHTLNWNGKKVMAYAIMEAIAQIESTLDPRFLKRLDESERLHREVLAKDPDHPGSWIAGRAKQLLSDI